MSAKNSGHSINPEDTFKILIATDCHLGYEYSKKRGHQLNDSFITFEEILQYGKDYEVDFILLGGDLFHDTKPSQTAILKCMELLRKYCFGPKENKIEFLSDPDVIFRHCAYKTVNYEDPNINVSMPIFSIHGNHDDPSFGAVGSMDLLSVSGLVNYFGKWTDLTKITIPPLVIKKGESHIALYGLSYINDQRLSRLFRDYKVDLLRPEGISDCFNMFVLHQNRVKHGEYAYIPENKLPLFLNFIVWGHEHECRITPEFVPDTEYFICQPGSSIATSLCEGEAKPKYIGLLSVNKQNFKLKKLKLKTVRPFVFDNLILKDHDIKRDYTRPLSDSVFMFVDNYIEHVLMPKAAEQLSGHANQPCQPLIRLRIIYTSEDEIFEIVKLAQKYCDEVANPMDMVIFRKEKNPEKSKSGGHSILDDFDDMAQIFDYENTETDWNQTVQGGIKKYFDMKDNKDKLTVLTVDGLNEALNRFVDKADTDAFRDIIDHQMKKTMEYLHTTDAQTINDIQHEIKNFQDTRKQRGQTEKDEICQIFDDAKRKAGKTTETQKRTDNNDCSEDEGQMEVDTAPTTKGRGRGTGSRGTKARGRGSRGGRGRGTEKDTSAVLSSFTSTNSKNSKGNTMERYMATSSNQRKNQIFLVDDDSD